MKIAVIGGKLQGCEALYLAKKAGWETILIDRNGHVPAVGLADHFVHADISTLDIQNSKLKEADLLLPATENTETLSFLKKLEQKTSIPLLYDVFAYRISSSKMHSDQFFGKIGIPIPKPWPDCDFPMLAKPSAGSGSDGIQILKNQADLDGFLVSGVLPKDWILQSYVEGPSYSLEIVGTPGNYTPLQVTDLEMDAVYDCKRVIAPTSLSDHLIQDFEAIAIRIAEGIRLRGLMDVEVILHQGKLKVLEIDARLPSQTPTAVFCSCGINILSAFASVFSMDVRRFQHHLAEPCGVIYEHIHVTPGSLEVIGERLISKAGPLTHHRNFYGADEAISNFSPGMDEWLATLIIKASDRDTAFQKRIRIIEGLRERFSLERYLDPGPSTLV